MKTFLPGFLGLLPALAAHAQINIAMNDMPSAGDTIRISNGIITATIDPVPTGANFLWDFSSLQHIDQTIDTFLTIGQTNLTYQLVYVNIALNPNRANLAAKGNFAIPPVPGITISDVYSFFYNSSSSYRMVGAGATLNGLATPAPFGNKDVVYNFPLGYNDQDSSDSDMDLTIPGLGYYGFQQRRVNHCDGWGTLITPFGTFNVLKVKSTLFVHDSVFISGLGTGFGQDRPVSREYKWLGKGGGLPLLEIVTTEVAGQENVTSIRYQDSARAPLGIHEVAGTGGIAVFPVPAKDLVYVRFRSDGAGAAALTLMDPAGRILVRTTEQLVPGDNMWRMPLIGADAGMCFLELRVGGDRRIVKVLVN